MFGQEKISQLVITGMGHAIPKRQVFNEEIVGRINTTDEFITQRTGVKSRFHLPTNEGVSSLMKAAALNAIKSSGVALSDIDALIVNTLTPDFHDPSQACLMQHELGLEHVPSFDIRAQCSGFLYALDIANGMLAARRYTNILIICGEALSKRMDCSDDGRNLSILLGDGAAAAVVSLGTNSNEGLSDLAIGADGSYYDLLKTEKPGSRSGGYFITSDDIDSGKHHFRMQGKAMFDHATTTLSKVASDLLQTNGVALEEVDWVICHQPNLRILEAVKASLQLPDEKMPINVEEFGNMASASLPLTLSMNWDRFTPGQRLLILAYGSGATWGAALYTVQNNRQINITDGSQGSVK